METVEIKKDKRGVKAPPFMSAVNAAIGKFLRTDFYIALTGALVFISWIFSIPDIILTVFLVIMTYILYARKSLVHIIPMLFTMCFMLPVSFDFYEKAQYWYMAIAAAGPVSGFVYFFVRNKIKIRKSRFLLPSLVFCGAFLLSGLFSPFYTLPMNFTMMAVMIFLYLFIIVILYSGIEKLEFMYIAKCLFAAAAVITLEMIVMFAKAPDLSAALIDKNTTEMGWGMSNTAGAVLAMAVPVTLYMAAKSKRNYAFYPFVALFVLAVFFTLSRGSILFMILFFPFGLAAAFWQTPKEKRKTAYISFLLVCAAVFVVIFAFWGQLEDVFTWWLRHGAEDSGRFEIYKDAWEQFKRFPFFGVGWGYTGRPGYNSHDIFYTVHDTVLQYMASGGIILTLAAVWLFGKRYLTFYADFKPYHLFFLFSLLTHDLYGLIDITAFLPYTIIIAGAMFIALEQDIRPEAEKAKIERYKKEKFYF